MSDAPLATVDDVADRWRPISDSEVGKVETLIGDASALLRAEYPDIDARIAAGGLYAAVVAAVVGGMVKNAMDTPPMGVSQDSATTGPYSRSQTFANPLGNIFLTAAQRTLIEGRRPKAKSVRFA